MSGRGERDYSIKGGATGERKSRACPAHGVSEELTGNGLTAAVNQSWAVPTKAARQRPNIYVDTFSGADVSSLTRP